MRIGFQEKKMDTVINFDVREMLHERRGKIFAQSMHKEGFRHRNLAPTCFVSGGHPARGPAYGGVRGRICGEFVLGGICFIAGTKGLKFHQTYGQFSIF